MNISHFILKKQNLQAFLILFWFIERNGFEKIFFHHIIELKKFYRKHVSIDRYVKRAHEKIQRVTR